MDVPDVIPQVELKGSQAERVRTLDAMIARLEALRSGLVGETATAAPPSERHGPYLNAPVWPWFAAGCAAGASFVLLFVLAWLNA